MMKVYKRAQIYITRRKKKSFILFLIFFTMLTLILIGLSILRGTETATQSLRKSLGASFTIKDTKNSSEDNQFIDNDFIEKVLSQGGIKEYNGINVFDLYTKDLTLEPGSQENSQDGGGKIPRFISNEKSELNEFFYNHFFELIEGRAITPEDKGKVLISKELAEYNNLKIGDTFTGEINAVLAEGNEDSIGTSFKFEIVGIFEIIGTQMKSGQLPENNLWENYIFTDNSISENVIKTIENNPDSIDRFRNGATFYVKDPKDIYNIVDNIKKQKDINLDGLKITINDEKYKEAVQPLENLSGLIKIMIVSILIISIILITLILTIWTKNRIHEIGVFLSIGIRKKEIIGQFILESLTIAIIAFVFSLLVTNILVNKVGNSLFDTVVIADETNSEIEENTGETASDVGKEINQTMDIESLNLSLGGIEVLQVSFLGTVLIVLSVGTASMSVIRLNPKNLLSRIS